MWILQSSDEARSLTFRLPAGATKTLGRAVRSDFVIDAAMVSRLHCRFSADTDGQLMVEDLDSTNGTFVNERRVHKANLVVGDRLRVGRVELAVSLEPDSNDE
jgi:pSer/pThr/pTyr-binding forkhead associated (FHA) protein